MDARTSGRFYLAVVQATLRDVGGNPPHREDPVGFPPRGKE